MDYSPLKKACEALISKQNYDGHWCFELEADCTMPADYIFMMHFTGDINVELQNKLANYILSKQNTGGGWPLFNNGPSDLSCSVKCYYALRLAGIKADFSSHRNNMLVAKEFILLNGGAAKANVFTRITLAQFNQIPWRGIPHIPISIMLFPKWFPFHIDKMAYWSKCTIVPLALLYLFKVKAKNPNNVTCREIFTTPPNMERKYFSNATTCKAKKYLVMERIGYYLRNIVCIPYFTRLATAKALDWMLERLNGEDGLGAIIPPMIYSYYVLLYVLNLDSHNPLAVQVRTAIDKLLVVNEDSAYLQPCVSPVWDTALASLALQEAERAIPGCNTNIQDAILDSTAWIASKQLKCGGWAFQYNNPHFPDVDDTAVCALALLDGYNQYKFQIFAARDWITSMVSDNGGYGAFDINNDYYYLNDIPFADHGAMIDPPTADVTGRCITFLSSKQLNWRSDLRPIDIRTSVQFLVDDRLPDGTWNGRWGTNYLWGLWSVITAFKAVEIPLFDPMLTMASSWILTHANADGGFGESNVSYNTNIFTPAPSNAFHTSLAILILCQLGHSTYTTTKRAVQWLLDHQNEEGLWTDDIHNAPGFPKVFYLKYHGYSKYFPIWALSKYYSTPRHSDI
jgi:squalene-hopene/tetraprenyl-beta-curcumene cyclase